MPFMCFNPHPYWEKEFCRYTRVSPSSTVRESCCVCMSVYNCASALTLTGKRTLWVYACFTIMPSGERCWICVSVYNCASALTLTGKKNSADICVFHHHVQWGKDVVYV
jgi:hypothetical protein